MQASKMIRCDRYSNKDRWPVDGTHGEHSQADHKPTVAGMSPVLAVRHSFGNGKREYYGRLFGMGEGANTRQCFKSAPGFRPSPLFTYWLWKGRESPYDGLGVLPGLYNVVDLGEGRTESLSAGSGEDSNSTDLVEYRDGV